MANISKVYLLSTPLEDDMKNTLYFANASAQQTYMNSCIVKSYTNVSYQREQMVFRCPAQIDTIRNCNYLMFQNTAYSNKWFYGFIKKMTYIDDARTDIEFEIDPLQTYMFDITVKPSFIEREHTNDDTIGHNTIPEPLEIGEYVCSATNQKFVYNIMYCYYVLAVTDLLSVATPVEGTVYNACIPDGCYYIALENISSVKKLVKLYSANGKKDAIVAIFVAPKECFSQVAFETSPQGYKYSTSPSMVFSITETVAKPADTILSYVPRNKKLLTFPFRFVQASNNAGQIVNYKVEDFASGPNMEFQLRFALSCGGNGRVFPRGYKGIDNNFDEGINLGKLPVGSWQNDLFTNWMTQNAINIPTSILGSVADTAIGLASGIGTATAVSSGLQGITSTVDQIYQHSLQPPQAEGNVCNGDVNFAYSMTCIILKNMSIKPEYARVVDDYLDMFGYATHRVKSPNVAHRQNWWYTKTIDVSITGNVPNEYMNQIKGCYNNGITFWRNPSNFLNYSVSNGIV